MSSQSTKTNPEPSSEAAPFAHWLNLSDRNLWILTALTALFYFWYSRLADGFYQQDEAAHFVNMKEFWHLPQSTLSNWAKPGYKLFYALPALLGSTFVIFFNGLLGALSCWLSYRLAEKMGSKAPLLAFAALAVQPLWLNLVFRNYSEILTAFLLVLGLWLHLRNRLMLAALAISYIAFVRQEMYPLLGAYFVWLVWKRQFIPAILLGFFPLVQNIWGGILNNDPLYLLNQVLKQSSDIAGAWPRQGFDHYFLMSVTTFGSVGITLLITYLTIKIVKKEQPSWELLIPFGFYFLLHSLFNWQGVEIGPSTGGNLRYMLIVSPILAAICALAVEELLTFSDRMSLLGALVVLGLAVAIFMSYEHNFVKFTEKRDWKPLISLIITGVIVMLPLKRNQYALALLGVLLLTSAMSVRPIKRSEEDKACLKLANWYQDYEKKNGERQLLLHHAMFYYFLNRTQYDFKDKPLPITEENIKKVPKGSLIIWDSHYSYRPELRKNCLEHTYFLTQPTKFKLIHTVEATSPDGQYLMFGALVFEKME
jgi:hypothetical protein